MDYHRNSGHPVASWLFRPEHQPQLPANRQLDPCFDRYRRHTHHIARVGDRLSPRFDRKQEGSQTGCLLKHNSGKQISNEIMRSLEIY